MKLNACLASFESFKGLVSQFHNFAVAKSEQFWQATGQLNMANRMEDCWPKWSCVGRKTKLWKLFATSLLYLKFDCPVASQNF